MRKVEQHQTEDFLLNLHYRERTSEHPSQSHLNERCKNCDTKDNCEHGKVFKSGQKKQLCEGQRNQPSENLK
jgi:hypothetical protein